jgi:histone-lysine N-methyltransferase SETMAR
MADQKQHHVNVCEELRQMTSDDATFLFRFITGDLSWIYGYGPETKQQSSQWKSPNSPRPKKARQVKSKVKSMLIIFFNIKGIVHKESFLAGQTDNSSYYCDVLWRLCENVRILRPKLWQQKNWLLHHDNTPSQTSFLTKNNMNVVPPPTLLA